MTPTLSSVICRLAFWKQRNQVYSEQQRNFNPGNTSYLRIGCLRIHVHGSPKNRDWKEYRASLFSYEEGAVWPPHICIFPYRRDPTLTFYAFFPVGVEGSTWLTRTLAPFAIVFFSYFILFYYFYFYQGIISISLLGLQHNDSMFVYITKWSLQ